MITFDNPDLWKRAVCSFCGELKACLVSADDDSDAAICGSCVASITTIIERMTNRQNTCTCERRPGDRNTCPIHN